MQVTVWNIFIVISSRDETLSGAKYFMSIMDDYSKRLKAKFDTFAIFKSWFNEVENERNSKIKCLRIDNGMKFLLNEFQNFCVEKGI